MTPKALFEQINSSIKSILIGDTNVGWVLRKDVPFTIEILTVSIDGTGFHKGEYSR